MPLVHYDPSDSKFYAWISGSLTEIIISAGSGSGGSSGANYPLSIEEFDEPESFPYFNNPVAGRNPSVTFTTTGTINDLDFSNSEYIRFNNASAVVINGLKAGYDGQRVFIDNIGTSTLKLAYENTGSVAANRFFTPSVNGQIIGGGGRLLCIYDGVSLRWRVTVVLPGTPIAVPFNAANFTAFAAGSWTLTSGDQLAFKYIQLGKYVTFIIDFTSTTTSGVTSGVLLAALPDGFVLTSAGITSAMAQGLFAGVFQAAVISGNPADTTKLWFYKIDQSAIANGTNNTDIKGSVTQEVD